MTGHQKPQKNTFKKWLGDELKRIWKCQEQICRFCKLQREKFVMSSIHNTTIFPNTFQIQLPTKMFAHDCIFGILATLSQFWGKKQKTC